MGWYSDTYVRTDNGWRLQTRSMTFLRRSGAADSGKPHDPLRPEPTAGLVDLDAFRTAVDAWLDEHADELAPAYDGAGTLDDRMAQIAKVRRLAFDAGWARWGWPEAVGRLRRLDDPAGLPERGGDVA